MQRRRMVAASLLAFALLAGACVEQTRPRLEPPTGLRSRAPGTPSQVAGASDQCIPQRLLTELSTCGPQRFAPIARSTPGGMWPRAEHVVTLATRAPWTPPLRSQELAEIVQLGPTLGRLNSAVAGQIAAGDRAYDSAAGQPSQWGVAARAYHSAIQQGGDGNELQCYARYRLANALFNQHDVDKALTQMAQVVACAASHAKYPGSEHLLGRGRADVILLFSQSRPAAQAFDFLLPLSGDGTGATRNTLQMMDALGQAYIDNNRYADAVAIYEELIRRGDGEQRCFYQGRITQAATVLKTGHQAKAFEALQTQLQVNDLFQVEPHTQAARQACAKSTAQVVTETAIAWHVESVGSDGVRGTGDARTMAMTDRLYAHVLASFTAPQIDAIESRNTRQDSGPTRARIMFARAALLYFQKKWESCGPAFEEASQISQTAGDFVDATYTAWECYHNTMDDNHKGGSRERYRKPMGEVEKSVVRLATQYLCHVTASKSDPKEASRQVEVKLARARAFRIAGWKQEAATLYRQVAVEPSDDERGKGAASYYLELLGELDDRLAGASCSAELRRDVPFLMEMYCSAGKPAASGEPCKTLRAMQGEIGP